jgi:hydrogenase nickel incorporation protein HypA/HybF
VHEWSIVRALLDGVEREARQRGASAVRRVRVRIGELSGVEIPLLEAAYQTFRERTACAQAPLEVEAVPARWECAGCRREVARGALLRCAECGGPARLAEGDEIVLQRIEMEIPEAAAMAPEEAR